MWLEAFKFFTWQDLLDQLFYIQQQWLFISTNQRNRMAFHACATGTADAMHVIFRHVWQFIVHYLWQLGNIDTARGDVGCHQHTDGTVFKPGQSTGTRALTLVTMNSGSLNIFFFQLLHQLVGTVLGAGKHQHLLPVITFDQMT